MAAAVSATSTFRLVSPCCGARSGNTMGGAVTVELGAALAGGCAGALLGTSAKLAPLRLATALRAKTGRWPPRDRGDQWNMLLRP